MKEYTFDAAIPYFEKNFRGANILYTLRLQNKEKILALVSSHHNHLIGQEIGIKPQVDEIVLFESDKFDLNVAYNRAELPKTIRLSLSPVLQNPIRKMAVFALDKLSR